MDGASADVSRVRAVPDNCHTSHAAETFIRTSRLTPRTLKRCGLQEETDQASHLDRLGRDIRRETRSLQPTAW